MEKIKNLLKNKRKEILIIVSVIIVIILFFSGYSLGKEYSSTFIETHAKIAEPILIVENNPTIEVNGKQEKEYYKFKVKNYKETGEITQVDLTYNIEILTEEQESISFKLYKENEEIILNDNKTADMKLTKEKIQEDCYELELLYDKSKNKSIEDIIQNVQIKVHSEQINI